MFRLTSSMMLMMSMLLYQLKVRVNVRLDYEITDKSGFSISELSSSSNGRSEVSACPRRRQLTCSRNQNAKLQYTRFRSRLTDEFDKNYFVESVGTYLFRPSRSPGRGRMGCPSKMSSTSRWFWPRKNSPKIRICPKKWQIRKGPIQVNFALIYTSRNTNWSETG